jgi:UPF0271 protein
LYESEEMKRNIVLDTCAFIMGYDPFLINQKQFTVPLVLKELFTASTIFIQLKLAIETGKVELKTPTSNFIKKIEFISTNTGDRSFFSEADIQVLALSLELKIKGFDPIIVTDDYSIQNVADTLDLEYKSLTTLGIQHNYRWIYYCPGCKRKVSEKPTEKNCKVCGTILKKRVFVKKPTKKRVTSNS